MGGFPVCFLDGKRYSTYVTFEEPMSFNPDWASPPGSIVGELRLERRISLHDFAGETGLTVPEVLELEEGTLRIDPHLAERLEYVFGQPPEKFWLTLQLNYDNDLKRGRKHD